MCISASSAETMPNTAHISANGSKRLLVYRCQLFSARVHPQKVMRTRKKAGAPAFRRSTFCPRSSASARTVFPKPQGVLKKRTLPCAIKLSNCFRTEGFIMMVSVIASLPLPQREISPQAYACGSESMLSDHIFSTFIHDWTKM